MAEKPGDGLSRRERQNMDVLYARSTATALEVVQALPDPPTKTAIRTILKILEEKGFVKHVQQGREYVYQPTRPRLRAGRSAFQRVLRTFFDGSLEKAVAAYLGDSTANLSADEIQRLTDLLQEAPPERKMNMTSHFVLSSVVWNEIALDLSIKSVLVLTVASVAALALKWSRSSAAARHLVWSLAVIGLLLLPLLVAVIPAVSVPVRWDWRSQNAIAVRQSERPSTETQLVFAWPESESAESLNSIASARTIDANLESGELKLPKTRSSTSSIPNAANWILAGWMAGCMLMLTPICLGLASLWSLRRRSQRVAEGPLLESLVTATQAMKLKRRPELLLSNSRDMPMTWGFLDSTILLPESAAQWPQDRLQVVLMHELAHIRRRDCFVQALAQFARALYWFNPLVWLAEHCIRIEQEQACDDDVLDRGFRPSDYATHLLSILAQHRRPAFAATLGLAMARSTKLERRLKSILLFAGNRGIPTRSQLTKAVLLTLLVVLGASAFQLRIAGADETKPAPTAKTAPNSTPADPFKAWAELREQIRNQYVGIVDEKDMEQAVIQGMLQSLRDPYSDFLTADRIAEMEKQISSSMIGIGVQLEMQEQKVRVVTPLPESPALEAGIQPGDIIVQVDGQSVEKLGLAEIVKRIAGPQGTAVRLKIRREGTETDIEAKRGPVKLESIKGFRRDPDKRWNLLLTSTPKIGYLQITQFNSQTPQELRTALEELNSQKAEGLILDLRFCPGGLLDAAVQSVKQFVPSGTIVSLHGRTGDPITMKTDGPASFGEAPLVVLVNDFTASAAEVVAGALQDNQRAIVIGTRTFGKGSVQTLIRLAGTNGAIRLTTSSYHLPSGRDIDRKPNQSMWGVNPNDGYFVPMDTAQTRTMMERRAARDVVGAKAASIDMSVTPETIEEQAGDPQLAAALKTLTNRLKTGTFAKINDLASSQIDQFIKRQEIEKRRAEVLRSLENLDRELVELEKK